jgi:hypothetical protein
MRIERVKRWQWVLLSVAVGAALGWAWRGDGADLARYGEILNDPEAFERGLFERRGGERRFTDVRVHRQTLDDGAGSRGTFHVVTGNYSDGRPDPHDGTYRWRPRFFVATIPYHVRSLPYDLGDGSEDDAGKLRTFEDLKSPTVVDYLKLLGETDGLRYTHAWWRTYPMATCVAGSVLLIGVLWPTVINLLVFGSFVRPREEEGIDLSILDRLEPPPAPPAAPVVDLTDHLRELEAELAARLAGGGDVPAPDSTAPSRAPAAVTAAPLEPAPAAEHAEHHYGARADDFYPTEAHAPHHETRKDREHDPRHEPRQPKGRTA